MSKPVLYTFERSVWAAVAEIAVAELDVDVDVKEINLMEGANFELDFVKLNKNATLPTLTHGSNVYTDTKSVVSHLNKIAALSSQVPVSTGFTDHLHEKDYDPNFALLLARSSSELQKKAADFQKIFLENRQNALETIFKNIKEPGEFEEFYQKKIIENGHLLNIYKAPDEDHSKFFRLSSTHVQKIHDLITQDISSQLESRDFVAGDKPGEDDFHLIGWVTRIVSTAPGATSISEYGEKLNVPIPPSVVSYWERWIERPSFKKVYTEGGRVLH